MTTDLKQLLQAFDRYDEQIPVDVLTSGLRDLKLTIEDLREFLCFGAKTYRRNLLHAGPAYQALLLCWRNGQRSPIHDHRGSTCAVRVLQGVATETLFERNAHGLIYATTSTEVHEGQTIGAFDSDIHQMSNLQPGTADLVSLHIYSPALLKMNTYSLTDDSVTEFVDPVFEFASGAGI